MFGRRLTTQSLDAALVRLGEQYALPRERAVAFERRVHDAVVQRFGTTRMSLETQPSVGIGLFTFLRPAAAVGVFLLLVVGTIASFRRSSDRTNSVPRTTEEPQASSDVVIAPPSVEPGSGSMLSVFGQRIAVALEVPVEASSVSARVRVRAIVPRAVRAQVNPSPGVFTQWGTGVFSEEEILRSARDGKHVLGG